MCWRLESEQYKSDLSFLSTEARAAFANMARINDAIPIPTPIVLEQHPS